jgi:hypothetical protein
MRFSLIETAVGLLSLSLLSLFSRLTLDQQRNWENFGAFSVIE